MRKKRKLLFIGYLCILCAVQSFAGDNAEALNKEIDQLVSELNTLMTSTQGSSPQARSLANQIANKRNLLSNSNEAKVQETGNNTTSNEVDELEKARKKEEAAKEAYNNALNEYNEYVSKHPGYTSAELTALKNEVERTEKVVDDLASINDSVVKGDPVLVTSGKFLFEDTDLVLNYGKNSFMVNRTYRTGINDGNSLGLGWETIFDSCLVRGITRNIDVSIQNLKNIKNDIKSIYTPLLSHNESYANIKELKRKLQTEMDKIDSNCNELTEKLNLSNTLNSLNAFSYSVSNANSYGTGNGTLIFRDEEGTDILFEYCENGLWKPTSGVESQYMQIKSKNGGDATTEAGFILYDKGGKQIHFDKWGLIEKILDKNNNEIQFVRNKTTKKLEKIAMYTGREILIDYNERGFVSKITCNNGKYVKYEYSGNYLTKVVDENGFVSLYEYDNLGYLIKFTKPDGSCVEYEYGLQDSNSERRTSATTNEEKATEYFDYDLENKVTEYTDFSGRKSYSYYDKNHKTTKEIDFTGIITTYTYDESTGNMLSKTVNGNKTEYSYDARGNKIQSTYSDGSTKKWTYNNFDQITRFIDRDGIVQDFFYDENGNLIRFALGGNVVMVATYDMNGNVLSIFDWQGNKNSFVYDTYLNIIEVLGKNSSEKYEYDSEDRITKYTNGENQTWTYSYTDSTTIENHPNGLKRIFTYNSRQEVAQIEDIDTVTDEKRVQFFEYDKQRRLTAVKSGSKILYSCEYYPTNEVKREIIGEEGKEDYWVTEYDRSMSSNKYTVLYKKFDKDGLQIGTTYSETISQKTTTFGTEITKQDAHGFVDTYQFDKWNRLTMAENALGESQERVVTKEGRITKEQSYYGGWYNADYDTAGNITSFKPVGKDGDTYTYNPDRTIATKTSADGIKTTYTYDENAQLIAEQSENYGVFYTYDNAGRITQQIIGATKDKNHCEQFTEWDYSADGRIVTVHFGDSYYYSYVLNAWGEVVSQKDANNNGIEVQYNEHGFVTKSFDAYGSETQYEYNALGEIAKIIYPDNSFKQYEYNNLMQVESVTDNEGIQWQGSYDEVSNLIKERGRLQSETEYSYDALGRVTSVTKAGEITDQYEYGKNELNLSYIDGNNNEYVYEKDNFGNLTREQNRLGDVQTFEYNSQNQLETQKDFNGNECSIAYNEKTNTQTIEYSDGTTTEFTYTMAGQIAKAKNITGTIYYSYNNAGLLVEQFDEKANERTYYTYDNTGRRINLASGNRNINYDYGKNGELLKIDDTEQDLCVQFEYDSMMRETVRHFGNGGTQFTEYDSIGRKIVIKEENENGQITRAEVYAYNENGQLALVANEVGDVTKYEYDSLGRLKSVYYPYDNDKFNQSAQEIAEAGLFYIDNITGDNLFLTRSEYTQLAELLEHVSYGSMSALTTVNGTWKESYTYDKNGNRLTKTTNFGTIEYRYDAENRLISRGDESLGTKYAYDKNGNLLETLNSYVKEQYVYNIQNRMAQSVVTNTVQNTQASTFYGYDAFGRRNIEQNLGKNAKRYLRDGQTHDIIKESEVFDSGEFITNYTSKGGNTNYSLGEETEERYRYVETIANDMWINTDSGTQAESFTGSRYALYANSKPIATNNIASSSGQSAKAYFGTDRLASVRQATNQYGDVIDQYAYDAFGTPYTGDLQTSINIGYIGKPYDATTKNYNYGYRDYNPQTARFTSIDPIRDGTNWFSYTANDPVNFVDLWGLEKECIFTRGTVFTESINQIDLDKHFNFTDGSGYTQSCKTASLINIYIEKSKDGISLKNLTKAIEISIEKKYLDVDGSPLDLDRFSRELAKVEGVDMYYAYMYDKNGIRVTKEMNDTFSQDFTGIVMKQKTLSKVDSENKTYNVTYTHFLSYMFDFSIKEIDSLDPNRWGVNDYKPIYVEPLQLVNVDDTPTNKTW